MKKITTYKYVKYHQESLFKILKVKQKNLPCDLYAILYITIFILYSIYVSNHQYNLIISHASMWKEDFIVVVSWGRATARNVTQRPKWHVDITGFVQASELALGLQKIWLWNIKSLQSLKGKGANSHSCEAEKMI